MILSLPDCVVANGLKEKQRGKMRVPAKVIRNRTSWKGMSLNWFVFITTSDNYVQRNLSIMSATLPTYEEAVTGDTNPPPNAASRSTRRQLYLEAPATTPPPAYSSPARRLSSLSGAILLPGTSLPQSTSIPGSCYGAEQHYQVKGLKAVTL